MTSFATRLLPALRNGYRSTLQSLPNATVRKPQLGFRARARYSTIPPLTAEEQKLIDRLKEKLDPTKVRVQDVSGGCGSFFAIEIESKAFEGLTTVKQHKLVSESLKSEIEGMHGLQIKTLVPK